MDFKVVISPEARQDLKEICEYIAEDNPDAALKFGDELIDKAFSLASFPNRGTFHKIYKRQYILHGSYLIFYSIDKSKQLVKILRIWHGKQKNFELDEAN